MRSTQQFCRPCTPFPSLDSLKGSELVVTLLLVCIVGDSGGYTGGNADDPVFQQLLIRWFQFGAFCPLFRLHGEPAALSTTTTQPSLVMAFVLDVLTGLTVLWLHR